MENKPWECPRCGKINAPFNPSCFCKKEQTSSYLEKWSNDPTEKMPIPIPKYKEHGWLE